MNAVIDHDQDHRDAVFLDDRRAEVTSHCGAHLRLALVE